MLTIKYKIIEYLVINLVKGMMSKLVILKYLWINSIKVNRDIGHVYVFQSQYCMMSFSSKF